MDCGEGREHGHMLHRQEEVGKQAGAQPGKQSIRQEAADGGWGVVMGVVRLQSFLPQYVETRPGGEFVSVQDGRRLGTHRGAALYTVGQGARVSSKQQAGWVDLGSAHGGDGVLVLLLR